MEHYDMFDPLSYDNQILNERLEMDSLHDTIQKKVQSRDVLEQKVMKQLQMMRREMNNRLDKIRREVPEVPEKIEETLIDERLVTYLLIFLTAICVYSMYMNYCLSKKIDMLNQKPALVTEQPAPQPDTEQKN